MNFKFKRFLQTLLFVFVVVYSVIFIYQRSSVNLINIQNSNLAPAEENEEGGILKRLGHLDRRHLAQEQDAILVNNIPANYDVSLATATEKPPSTDLNDVFISVKTTKHFHQERLPIILKTWFQLAKEQTWFFTDTDDADFQRKTGSSKFF